MQNRSPGQVADRRTHTPQQEENMMTTIPHSVTSASTNNSYDKIIEYQGPLLSRSFCRLIYIKSMSLKLAGLASPSENNKRFIFPQHVRHFGFPLMFRECIVGSA